MENLRARRIAASMLLLTGCGNTPQQVEVPQVEVAPSTAAPAVSATEGPPTEEEWREAPEVLVQGAAALGCEARAVPDWLRVSCSGLSFFAAKAWRVTVHGAHADGDVVATQKYGDVRLAWRFARGSRLSASFVWFPHIFRLAAEWPPSAAERPETVGRFDGAPEERAAEIMKAVCACQPRVMPEPLAKVSPYGCAPREGTLEAPAWDPGCARHALAGGEGACGRMNECMTSEPGSFKMCAPDELLSGVPSMGICVKRCGPDEPCPSGFTCEPSQKLTNEGLVPGPTACEATDEANTAYYREPR